VGGHLGLSGTLSARARAQGRRLPRAAGELERLLDDRFGIHHTTLQVDHDQPAPLLEFQ
jgi:hypothetical protein